MQHSRYGDEIYYFVHSVQELNDSIDIMLANAKRDDDELLQLLNQIQRQQEERLNGRV
jgi:hypothetical protein